MWRREREEHRGWMKAVVRAWRAVIEGRGGGLMLRTLIVAEVEARRASVRGKRRLTVTSTTVGYGDFYPTTPAGKAFTCVYALIGITVILGAISPLVAFMKGDWREKLLACCGCGDKVNLNDPKLSMHQINALINYPRRYCLALIGPLIVLFTGVCIHYFTIREPNAYEGTRIWCRYVATRADRDDK